MPVVKTDKTFKQLKNEAEDTFDKTNPKSAVALVYHGGGAKDFIGIRIESADLGKEFVSRVPFGRDPEGLLYYNDVKELRGFGVYEIRFRVGQVLEIKIFTPNRKHVATFVGRDPASAIGWLQFDADHPDVPLIGDWKDFNGTNVKSHIKCQKGSHDVTIELTGLGRNNVTFQLPKPSANGIDHKGITTITSLDAIAAGTHSMVDWDSDRVLFYPKTGDSVMTAFFIPEIAQQADLVALGGQKFISYSQIATWH